MSDYFVGEREFRTLEFYRGDGRGGLTDGETLTGAPTVKAYSSAGVDVSAQMVSDVLVYASTQVRYLFRAEVTGAFTIVVSAQTSNGQILIDRVVLSVGAPY